MQTQPVTAPAQAAPSHVIPFPSERTRSPAAADLLDLPTWQRAYAALHVATEFRTYSLEQAHHGVAALVNQFGAVAVARILDDNKEALSLLRGLVASLSEADRRISTAADAFLQARGA